jgi:hypothetical protein
VTKKILRSLYLRSARNSAVLVLLLGVLLVSAAPLGAAGRVKISLGFGYGKTGGYGPDTWGTGYELGILVRAWKTMGFRVSGIVFAEQLGLQGAVTADAGFWKSFGSDRVPSILLLGASFRVGTDADGSDLNAFGAHAGFRQELWLGRNLGLYGQGVLRIWFGGEARHQGEIFPSLSGGLSLRF